MDYLKKYKKRIDEIEEYMEFLMSFDEINTPDNNRIDVIQTPQVNDIDEIKTPTNNSIDAIKTPSNYDSELKVKKVKTYVEVEKPYIPPKVQEEVEDWLEDYLLYAYVEGTDAAGQMMGTDYKPNEELMAKAIAGGLRWDDKLKEHLSQGDVGLAKNLAETEFHRVYNTAIINAGIEMGATQKKWSTMLDEKVRDTHEYLEGLTLPIEKEFFTFDGDSAMCPGGFLLAQNNVNCRCILEIS